MKYLGLAVASLFWTAAVSAQSVYENYTVALGVNKDASALSIISGPQGWVEDLDAETPVAKRNGFVGFEQYVTGTITLALDAMPSINKCTPPEFDKRETADPGWGAEWVITKVELSAWGDEEKQKGKNWDNNQPAWLRLAFPEASKKGILRDVDRYDEEATTSLVVTNLNNHIGPPKWIYYRVTATNCGTGAELTTDPAWKNGGK